jgi:hypothetical protein
VRLNVLVNVLITFPDFMVRDWRRDDAPCLARPRDHDRSLGAVTPMPFVSTRRACMPCRPRGVWPELIRA